MFAWHDPEVFDCAICEKKPSLKKQLGCHGGANWGYPPSRPKYHIDRCPVRVITPDVMALFVSVSLSGGEMSISEQRSVPARYAEAYLIAAAERNAAIAWRARRDRHG